MTDAARINEAIEALRRDPTHPVRITVDGRFVVELRAVEPETKARKSAADVFREIGRWEGEAGAQLDALFSDARQKSNRSVDELP